MSPLARSLLTIVVLLSATNSQGCNVWNVAGRQTPYNIDLPAVYIPPPGGRLDITDECLYRGARLAGIVVQACNRDRSGTPPYVTATSPYSLPTDVDVMCTGGCAYGVTARVVLYCM